MRTGIFYIISGFFLIQCSPIPGENRGSAGIAGDIQGSDKVISFCTGEECCSKHQECTRICDRLFFKSEKQVKKQCRSLPKDTVKEIDNIVPVLQSPVLSALEYLDLSEEFRLLLALDYQVLVRIIKDYTLDRALTFTHWFAANKEPSAELLLLKDSARNEIIYEMLASAGDRNLHGPVEKALAKNISFDKSFFQLIISHSNYDLLQMSHEMIKADICSVQYIGTSKTELCVLRIYCKEKKGQNNEYVHSEDLRNEMARNITDEEFFKYVEKEVLYTGLGISFTEPIMNNQVCTTVCNDVQRGCE